MRENAMCEVSISIQNQQSDTGELAGQQRNNPKPSTSAHHKPTVDKEIPENNGVDKTAQNDGDLFAVILLAMSCVCVRIMTTRLRHEFLWPFRKDRI